MGENHFASPPTAAYGVVMVCCAVAFTILQLRIIAQEGSRFTLARAVGTRTKERLSLLMYVAAVPLAFVQEWISDALFVAVTLMWLVLDSRIEAP